MATVLARVDKNGTKYWISDVCPKCGGTGIIPCYSFIEGGVCFDCGGTGIGEQRWTEHTEEYEKKLAAKRMAKEVAKAPEMNAKFIKREGFSEDGKAWVVVGNTYKVKEDLKAAGCKWNPVMGWHFNTEQSAFPTFEISIDKVCEKDASGRWEYSEKSMDTIKKMREDLSPKAPSEWVGEVGEKVTTTVRIVRISSYHANVGGFYGTTINVFIFKDEKGNTIIWKTASFPEWVQNDDETIYTIKGTVKEHGEYKGIKQTIITRCKLA